MIVEYFKSVCLIISALTLNFRYAIESYCYRRSTRLTLKLADPGFITLIRNGGLTYIRAT